nr:dihydropteroate synthase [Dermabacter hominis]
MSKVRSVLDFSSAPAWRHVKGLPSSLTCERTLVMGVLNVTPDSFSDGGRHNQFEDAIVHAERLVSEGADIIDVGGESTRPGGSRVSEEEELRRTVRVVEALAQRGMCVSIDTMRASVARAAVEAGALIVNDVSAGLADPAMFSTVAGLTTHLGTAPVYIAMHWRGHSQEAMSRTGYEAIGTDVARELGEQIDRAVSAGIARESIVADPGFGFSKTGEDNWDLYDQIGEVEALELPLLIGVSRKRFVSALDVDRDAGTAALSGLAQLRRSWAVRVHDVASSVANIRVMQRLMAGPDGRDMGLGAGFADRNYESGARA